MTRINEPDRGRAAGCTAVAVLVVAVAAAAWYLLTVWS